MSGSMMRAVSEARRIHSEIDLGTPPHASGVVRRRDAGSDPLVGRNVADHHVERLLARGGIGNVYVVRSLATGDRYAMKVLRKSLARDVGMRSRFEREVRYLHR